MFGPVCWAMSGALCGTVCRSLGSLVGKCKDYV